LTGNPDRANENQWDFLRTSRVEDSYISMGCDILRLWKPDCCLHLSLTYLFSHKLKPFWEAEHIPGGSWGSNVKKNTLGQGQIKFIVPEAGTYWTLREALRVMVMELQQRQQ
jgi:hypothetical protein